MTKTHRTIATDSEVALHEVVGDDATATFEDNPQFAESNPGADGSSENVEEQRDSDDTEDSDEKILDDEDEEEEKDEEEVAMAAAVTR